MSLDAYFRYLESLSRATERAESEEPVSTPQDDVPIGWIIAAVLFAYFVVFLIEEFS